LAGLALVAVGVTAVRVGRAETVAKPAPATATPEATLHRPASDAPKLALETYRLANGLDVILHEDHRVPEVVVDLWYKVGSKDEVAGKTGFAHLFEHLMFQGSKHVPEDKYFELLQKAGASNVNGSTAYDRTNYFEVVPANQLALALWLESDRMGFLLERPSFQATLDNQRDVVKNERRQRIENRPMGLVDEVQLTSLFPASHPYHHEVIGSMADLSRASVDDVKAFFHRYYAPNNATLVVAGDIQPAAVKAAVEKYFGPIPAAAPIVRNAPPLPRLTKPITVEMEAKVQQPQLILDWVTPANFNPGDRELDVLATVLAGGKSSRLYQRLVYDSRIAENVSASQQSLKYASIFEISATPMPGHTLDEVKRLIEEELAKLQKEPPSAQEVTRAKNQIEFDLMRSMESLLARAERFQSYNDVLGNPDSFAEDMAAYQAIGADDLVQAARTWLPAEGRLTITVDPNPAAPIMGRVKKSTQEGAR
jgi:predicted Zn-dependent peptidase